MRRLQFKFRVSAFGLEFRAKASGRTYNHKLGLKASGLKVIHEGFQARAS